MSGNTDCDWLNLSVLYTCVDMYEHQRHDSARSWATSKHLGDGDVRNATKDWTPSLPHTVRFACVLQQKRFFPEWWSPFPLTTQIRPIIADLLPQTSHTIFELRLVDLVQPWDMFCLVRVRIAGLCSLNTELIMRALTKNVEQRVALFSRDESLCNRFCTEQNKLRNDVSSKWEVDERNSVVFFPRLQLFFRLACVMSDKN